MTTGFRELRDGVPYLVFERRYRAPIIDVWDSITESERLGRWFGTWSGDPTSGRVTVVWTAEEGQPASDYEIEICDAPRRLRVHSVGDDTAEIWTLDLALSEAVGVTTLRFAQLVEPHVNVADVGPGWQYYLDRLDAARSGLDASTVSWGEEYLRLGERYAEEFASN